MNREILFKAWDKFDKKFYKVESIKFNCFEEIKNITVFVHDSLCKSYVKNHNAEENNINALILCEYTGLEDKNGVKVFENDILQLFDTIGNLSDKVTVKWNSETACYEVFQLNGNHYSFDVRCAIRSCEVIGNIFDEEVR